MLGRGDGADYPLGADLYPFCAKVNRERVGAGLLAMGVNDDAGCLEVRGALRVHREQAGLAPTGSCGG